VKPVVHTLIPCSRSLCSPKGICLHEHSWNALSPIKQTKW
jgi:hypothetical protein